MANENLVAPTAVLCAKVRSRFTDLPYSKEIYSQVRKDKCSLGLIYYPLLFLGRIGFFENVYPMLSILEGRYKSTNNAIAKLEDCSVLELAAGISPRGLEATDGRLPFFRKDSIYVETDLPDMIERKEKMVRSIRANQGRESPKNHRFLPLNVMDYSQFARAGEEFRRSGNTKPIVVVSEGLGGYLETQKDSTAMQMRVRDNIARFLEEYSNSGAWVTPDFSGPWGSKTQIPAAARVVRKRIRKTTKTAGVPFKSEQEAKDFLALGQLDAQVVPNEHLVPNLRCLRTAGIGLSRALKVAPSYRAWYIKLK